MSNNPWHKAGVWVVTIPVAACAIAMSNGADWPDTTFYAIAAAAGAVGGAMIGKYRLAGAVGGSVSALGALYATVLIAHHFQAFNKLVFLAGALGALPGVGLYRIVTYPVRRWDAANSLSQFDESQWQDRLKP